MSVTVSLSESQTSVIVQKLLKTQELNPLSLAAFMSAAKDTSVSLTVSWGEFPLQYMDTAAFDTLPNKYTIHYSRLGNICLKPTVPRCFGKLNLLERDLRDTD